MSLFIWAVLMKLTRYGNRGCFKQRSISVAAVLVYLKGHLAPSSGDEAHM